MCDGADAAKCSARLYFGTHQIPMVAGANWAEDTQHPFENLTCTPPRRGGTAVPFSCDCGTNPCGEYVFDHRNASLRAWWVDEYMGAAMAAPGVDGLLLDDRWTARGGPSEEDKFVLADTALAPADVAAVISGLEEARSALAAAAAARGAWLAPGYVGLHMANETSAACAARLRAACTRGAPPGPAVFYAVLYEWIPPPAFGVRAVDVELD
eukprot:gene4629-1391_t